MEHSPRIERHLAKELFRFVVAGSVDDGKSTLLGRLLLDAAALFEDQLADATVLGPDGIPHLDLSLLTDGLLAERDQQITIDVAYRYFTTERRKFIVADTPGHLQYTRNMVTGASTADAALLLVDASRGPTEQTRRHAFVAARLGIRELIVCVNKMDLVAWSQERFDAISGEFYDLLAETGFDRCHLIPVCATLGDNVVRRSERLPWARATLLGLLETLPLPAASNSAPVRLWVQLLLKSGDGVRRYAGTLATGRITVADRLLLLPSGLDVGVTELTVAGRPSDSAVAGESMALRFDREVDCARGDLLCCLDAPAQATSRLEASLVWFGDQPLRAGARLLLRIGSRETTATIAQLLDRTDLDRLTTSSTDRLDTNDLGRVRISTLGPLPFDPFELCKSTGAFVLIDPQSRQTVGAGMLAAPSDERPSESAPPSGLERQRRLGHGPLAILVPQGADQAAIDRLERRLFDAGLLTASAHEVEQAVALLRAGVVVVSTVRTDAAFETVLLCGSDESAWWLQLEPLLFALRGR
jgi:bifunctional enzyme CysN/CysC/sulfate adenylyltransferase subunit 1